MTSKFLRPFSRQKRYVQCGKKSSLVVEKKKSWFSYPLSTPRTRLSMKKEPITMRGTKQTKLKDPPKASLVCKRFKSALTLIAHSQKFKLLDGLGWGPLHFHCTTSISAPYSPSIRIPCKKPQKQRVHCTQHHHQACLFQRVTNALLWGNLLNFKEFLLGSFPEQLVSCQIKPFLRGFTSHVRMLLTVFEHHSKGPILQGLFSTIFGTKIQMRHFQLFSTSVTF